MKYVLVSYHPYNKSFNAAIIDRIKESIKTSDSLEHIDLAEISFNLAMSSKELFEFAQARTERGVKLENLDPQAVQFAETINNCDHLIMVFPIWWELMPGQMKGFIDKVVFPGLFYTYKTEFTMKVVSERLKRVSIITTMNTPAFLYRLKFQNPIYNALAKGTFKKLGIKDVRWINWGFIKKIGDKRRKSLLEKLPAKLSI